MDSAWVEVLPGRLFWAPGGCILPASFRGSLVDALSLSDGGVEDAGARYFVEHYAQKNLGRAFGPLGLEAVLRFCRGLRAQLEGSPQGVALCTPGASEATRTNACALFGAYLVFELGWSGAHVAECLGRREATRCFVCSWAREDRPEPPRNLTLRDCWQGFEAALKHGWVDVGDEECAGEAWRYRLAIYDSAWLIPGAIMVSADPVTTAVDPNPATLSDVFPERLPPMEIASASTSAGTGDEDGTESDMDTGCGGASPFSNMSTDTVCKDYRPGLASPKACSGTPSDFVTFLRESCIGTIVRANYHDEPGMPKDGSYDAQAMKAHGFKHYDLRMPDFHGGVPKRHDVSPCRALGTERVVLACRLAIDRFDTRVSGSAISSPGRGSMRPGAVTTPQQELFLKSLDGRQAVRRYADLGVAGNCCSCQ